MLEIKIYIFDVYNFSLYDTINECHPNTIAVRVCYITEWLGVIKMLYISSQWTISELACYTYSLVPVPLYDTLGTEAIDYIIDKSESSLHSQFTYSMHFAQMFVVYL